MFALRVAKPTRSAERRATSGAAIASSGLVSQVVAIAAGWAFAESLPPTREVRFQFANLGFMCIALLVAGAVMSLRKTAFASDTSHSLASIVVGREISISVVMAIYVLCLMVLDPFLHWFNYSALLCLAWLVPLSVAVLYFLRKRNWFAATGAAAFIGVATAVMKYNVRWIDHGVGFFSWWTT